MTRLSLIVVTLAMLAAPPSWAARRSAPQVIEDALAAATVDRADAIRMLEAELSDAKPNHRAWLLAHLGEHRRVAGDVAGATRAFNTALQNNPEAGPQAIAELGLVLIAAPVPATGATLAVLINTDERLVPGTQNATRFMLLALSGAGDADAHGAEALSYAAVDPALRDQIRRRLAGEIDATEPAAEAPADPPGASERPADTAPSAPDTAEPLPPGSADPDTAALDAARSALGQGDATAARELLRALRSSEDPSTRAAADTLWRVAERSVDPARIGVVLPLSGRYGGAGRQVQQAIEYGWRRSGASGKLVFVDSGSSPSTAAQAVEDLVVNKGVIAVIGPLLSPETDAVVNAAELLGVPLISVSQGLDDATGKQWVFQGWLTPRQQIRALLDHLTSAGMSRFAVFAPSSDYGRGAASQFGEEVRARGATVVVQTFYAPDATEFITAARQLGRKERDGGGELSRRRAEARAAGRDPSKIVLSPLLDFDAIFLPESASRVPLISSALAYEEFPVGDFRTSRDGRTIPLLGLSGWNRHDIITAGGTYTRNALFTDVFVGPPDSGFDWHAPDHWQRFVDAYRADVGRRPSPLEALAVDVGHVVGATHKLGPRTRTGFAEALLSVDVKGTITGATGFDADERVLRHDVRVLSIDKNGFVPVDR